MQNPYQYLRVCAWSGIAFAVLTFFFWGLLGRNIPPLSAALSAGELSKVISDNQYAIRAGMVVEMVISPLPVLWGIAISKVMERVERGNNVLSTLQLWGASITAVNGMIGCAVWLTAAFRPDDVAPETTRMLWDMGWMFFDMTYGFVTLQIVPIALCFLNDRRDTPLVPRWFSWFCLWFALSLFIVSFMPFFREGAFARNGLINFWYEFSMFFFLFFSSTMVTLRAIGQLEAEHAAGTVDV